MIKNVTLEIKAIENGFIVREWKETLTDKELDYTYKSKQWMFTNWTDVLDWVKNNELEVPPQA